jgi:hypothetical protein
MKKQYFLVLISSLLAMFFSLNCSSSKESAVNETKETVKKEVKTIEQQIMASVTKAPRMVINDDRYTFKDVEEGTNVIHEWEIKNIGTDTLYISDVESSCGCTAALPDSKIVAPNSSTKVKATFNTTSRVGSNTKFVTIHSNDSVAPNKQLVLEGRVIPKTQPKTN